MSDMDKDLTDMNEKGRNEVQEVLAMATGVTTMIIEELDKNPQLIENIKTLGEKYADVILAIAKPIVEYTKEQELALCAAKYDALCRHFGRPGNDEDHLRLLAIAYSK